MPFAKIRTPFAARRRRSACPLSSMALASSMRCTALPSLIACSQQVSSSSMHAEEISPETVRRFRCWPSSLSIRNTNSLVHRCLQSFTRSNFLDRVCRSCRNRRQPTWQGPNDGIVEQGVGKLILPALLTRQNSWKSLSIQGLLTSHRCDEVA